MNMREKSDLILILIFNSCLCVIMLLILLNCDIIFNELSRVIQTSLQPSDGGTRGFLGNHDGYNTRLLFLIVKVIGVKL